MTKTLRALLVTLIALPASAGNIKLGALSLNPYYGFETRYEDNIYRVPRNINNHAVSGGGVRGSWIFSNNLGLRLAMPVGEQHKVTGMYDVVFDNYKTQPSANNAINQRISAGYEFKGSKLSAKVNEDYINTQDPAFNPNGTVVNGALVARERRWQNTLGTSLDYALGDKFFAGVDAQTSRQQYLNHSGGAASLANILNTSEVSFGVKGGYKIAPKTKVFAAIHRVLLHYTEETRQDNHRDWLVDFGVEGQLTARLKGLVQGGFDYKHFDFDSSNPTRQRISRHARTLIKLDFTSSENGLATLTANRASNDSSSTGSRYFISSGVNLAYRHKFGKVTAGVNGGVQYDKYSDNFTVGTETKTRRDDNYQLGVKADYQIKQWLSTGLFYTHNARYSTFSRQFNYKDNVTGANVRFSF
ncbi:MAG: outer membrane beta-barrel protein [Elusimicrobia bacterium]|nr:outer membrane beta-barrel protein [Elusimicrobiota bacterium]